MASPGVHVEGLRETIRSLERFGVAATDLKAAFKRIGSIVAHEAVAMTPTLTGRLAASIRASNTKNKSQVRAGSARVPYAGVIHYGGYNNITGVPFLTMAVQNKQQEAVRQMETDLNRLIQSLDLN